MMTAEPRASKRASGHNLFLLECILALLFFSLAAAVCAQLFGKAFSLQQETKDLDRGTLLAQSAAEAFRSCGGDLEDTAALLHTSPQGESLSVWYAEDGEPASPEGTYLLRLDRREENGVAYAAVTVSREDRTVASLETAFALPLSGEEGAP